MKRAGGKVGSDVAGHRIDKKIGRRVHGTQRERGTAAGANRDNRGE